jgi:polar amino acid transport system permease protein
MLPHGDEKTTFWISNWMRYRGAQRLLDIVFQPVEAAILALGLITAAYMAKIYRARIMAIDQGQFKASRALGLTQPQVCRDVVLPQAFRIVLPATGNQFVGVLRVRPLQLLSRLLISCSLPGNSHCNTSPILNSTQRRAYS